jgi:hypothetical protein
MGTTLGYAPHVTERGWEPIDDERHEHLIQVFYNCPIQSVLELASVRVRPNVGKLPAGCGSNENCIRLTAIRRRLLT